MDLTEINQNPQQQPQQQPYQQQPQQQPYQQQPYQQQPQQQPYQQPTPPSNGNGIDWGGEIQKFFKEDLKNLIINIFKHPASGAQKFLETSSKTVVSPLCMVVLAFVSVTFFTFLIGAIHNGADFKTSAIIGLFPVFFSIFITLLMFLFLAIKQKSDILLAFRHSSIHVFLISLVIIFTAFLSLFFDFSWFNLLGSTNAFLSIIIGLSVVYAISMGICASRQTLQTYDASQKEGYSWYTAPIVVTFSIYLTFVIIKAIIF